MAAAAGLDGGLLVGERSRNRWALPAGQARRIRVNHTYQRRGALAYLAAYDVHRGKVLGRTADTTGIAEFGELVTQIMTQEPYASADRVFWIVDKRLLTPRPESGRPPRQAILQRDNGAHPGSRVLAQAEIYFTIVQRKVFSPNDFTDIDAVTERLSASENRYNQTALPFRWKFTATDLTELLARLDNHKPMLEHDPAQPRVA